jgi:PKD repeat protein
MKRLTIIAFLFIAALVAAREFPICFSVAKVSGVVEAQGSNEPELPRVLLDTSFPATPGSTINVTEGGSLQAALNSALPGDVIVLQAGATYTGNFTLPAKTGNSWVVIRTSNMAGIPAEGTRATSSDAGAMPKVLTPNAAPAIATAQGAHHYRFVGIEFGVSQGAATNFGVINFGDGGAAQNSLSVVPHDLVVDRCYIHGNQTGNISRGVTLNSASTAIIDSSISNCHGVGFDTQAICGWNGPGPFKVVNNYLEGAGENVMFGGADPKIANMVPSDIEFRRNTCSKPLSWCATEPSYAGVHWSVKNLFELKNAQRVLVDGNTFENNWLDGQVGFAIQFTTRNQEGTAPWSVVQDVTFTNNIVRHSSGGINFLGHDDLQPSQQTQRVKVKNNLFTDIGGSRWGGNGRLFQLIDGTAGVRIDHNTAFQSYNVVTTDGRPHTDFVYTNNLSPHNDYGVIGSGHGVGNDTLLNCFPACVFSKNVLVAGPNSAYPFGNFFPAGMGDVSFVDYAGGNYRLAQTSQYKNAGTDGLDIGADIDAIQVALGLQPPTNQPPVVSASATPTQGSSPLTVNFSPGASDPDGTVVAYSWVFGDGQSSTQPAPSHVYQTTGTFTARLTVTDNGGATASSSVTITVAGSSTLPDSRTVVLYASEATVRVGNWQVVADSTAAGGKSIFNPDAGLAKVTTPAANPASYFEMTFTAQAGTPYHLWMRGKALNNSPFNDSVHVQFSDSKDSSGTAIARIGTTTSTEMNLEDCLGCGLSGWGWQDNGWGVGAMGQNIYFQATGTHRIRVQVREDGISIDQIVLSPAAYLSGSPGALKNDTTILAKSTGSAAAPVVSAISPNSGTVNGGVPVAISGSGFLSGASVSIGGRSATSVNVVSGTSITAVTPSHAAGTVDVVVTNADGLRGTLTGGYTYRASTNQPPHVEATASVTSGAAPLVVNFTANASDPDGTVTGYSWDFGDGQMASAASPSHTYMSTGAFTARVTVTDNAGATASASVAVTVSSSSRPLVLMIKPNAPEVLIINSSYLITWAVTGTNISSQTVQLSLDGGSTWQDVVTGLSGSKRSYSWVVPNLPTKTGRIRVLAFSGGTYGEGMSASNFTIARKAKSKQKAKKH